MSLTSFLEDLLASGQVTVAGQPGPFAAADLAAAAQLLGRLHAADALELPGAAPAFDAPVALWAAQFLYRAIQLALLRELDEAAVTELLADFAGPATPEAAYSADLTFRYLPDLLRLAQGLAPDDVLVARLREAAGQWPFSFVGAGAGPHSLPPLAALSPVLAHPALRLAYADRIIGARDRARAAQPEVAPLVEAALGNYGAILWPEFAGFTGKE